MVPETAAVFAELSELWTEAKQMVRDAAPQALTYRPGDGFNSISAIVTHLTGSQKWWVGEILAGRDMHRDRDAEFRALEADPAVLVRRIDEAATLVREILETVTADMVVATRLYRGQPVTVRWILMRLLAHSARHVGQIQIIRKLWGLQHTASVC
jgi:uncharacterized damage-inducible protein DinB